MNVWQNAMCVRLSSIAVVVIVACLMCHSLPIARCTQLVYIHLHLQCAEGLWHCRRKSIESEIKEAFSLQKYDMTVGRGGRPVIIIIALQLCSPPCRWLTATLFFAQTKATAQKNMGKTTKTRPSYEQHNKWRRYIVVCVSYIVSLWCYTDAASTMQRWNAMTPHPPQNCLLFKHLRRCP